MCRKLQTLTLEVICFLSVVFAFSLDFPAFHIWIWGESLYLNVTILTSCQVTKAGSYVGTSQRDFESQFTFDGVEKRKKGNVHSGEELRNRVIIIPRQ